MRDYHVCKKSGALAAVACAIVLLARSTHAQNDGAEAYQPPEGMQVLTRGPVHEAFAEPIVYNPEPGPVVPKEPPQPVDESPPDQKPEGENVQWIPGYWSWDEAQGDFLWVSGIWRDIPPGRQWVPGYWVEAKQENGWRRVAGTWASTAEEQVAYLPEPPKSLEVGPNVPQPNPESLWVPGGWYWGEERYSWRPGFWLPVVADWVWVPAHYVWTPGGYLFVGGYWDRPLVRRGIVFAPVRFERPIYTQPQFAYTPAVTLVPAILTTNLFVRPATYQYYFGDYYGARFANNGYYPWYEFSQSRRGYDPAYAQLAAINSRQNPQWPRQLAEVYQYRRTHAEARPPQTYSGLLALAQRAKVQQAELTTQNVTAINNINAQNALLAQPIGQLASNDRLRPARFERVAPERREGIVKQVRALREVSDRRVREEAKVVQDRPANFRLERPRFAALPRSPIVAEAATPARPGAGHEPGKAAAPPPPPTQSAPALAAQPGSPADPANQKPDEREKSSRRRVLRPRPDGPPPGDGPQGRDPNADTPRPDQTPSTRPGGRPGSARPEPGASPKPPAAPPDRSLPDPKAERQPNPPDRPTPTPGPARPGLPGRDQARPTPPGAPRAGSPGADLDRPRPGRPGPTSPASPKAARPDSPIRPGLDRAPDRPGSPQPGQPGAGRADLPAGPNRPNLPDRPGSSPELPPGSNRPGTRPETGGPNPTSPGQPVPNLPDRPGMNRPGVRPDLPGTPRPNQPGLGRPGQPDAKPIRPAPATPGVGSPNRPGLNPAGRDGAINRRAPREPSPATTKPAQDSSTGQP